MKKLIFALSAFGFMLVGASSVSAQDVKVKKDASKKVQGKKHLGKRGGAFEKLNLTDAQKSSIKSINDKYKTEMQSLMKKDDVTVKVQRESKKALMDKKQKEIEAILTAEQKAELAKFKAEHKKGDAVRFHEGKGRGEGFGKRSEGRFGAAYLKDSIGLSDSQLATVRADREKSQAKIKAIKANTSLSDTQKKEQFKAAMDEQKAAFDKVLTAEQKEKMKTKQGMKPRMAK